jgi:hypothetical protein
MLFLIISTSYFKLCFNVKFHKTIQVGSLSDMNVTVNSEDNISIFGSRLLQSGLKEKTENVCNVQKEMPKEKIIATVLPYVDHIYILIMIIN